MYHAKTVEKRLAGFTESLRPVLGRGFEWRDTPVAEVKQWVKRLEGAWDAEIGLKRPLTAEEERWILHEIHRCKADFAYWATRYAYIKTKGQELVLFRFLESQELILTKVGRAELASLEGRSGDGVLLQILKARQLGASTLTEAMIAHRVIFYSHTTALVAGDVDEQSTYLFEMILRIYDNLPWWMKPEETFRVKGRQLAFGKTDSQILVESGKKARGGDSKEKGGVDKGSIGTGKTYPLVHLSELALWPNAGQLDDALEPAIPRHARTLAVYESTAKGRQNWWHEKWLASREGYGRFTPIFIPWYAENVSYTKPAPEDWNPSETTMAHAKKAEDVGRRWLEKDVKLNRDQLYWWETTRADYIRRKKLYKFLAEYAADDLEAFQHSGKSVFGAEMLNELRQRTETPAAVIDIVSGADYAQRGI